MDPLADKIMTCSAFIAFVESSRLNPNAPVKVAAWMVIIIVARELAITGLRLLAASKSIVLAAEKFGKHKTVSQIVAINALLVVDACHEWPVWLQGIFFTRWVDRVLKSRALGDGGTDRIVRPYLSMAEPFDLFKRYVRTV